MIGIGMGGVISGDRSIANVKIKGARGDGATDDTAAIQAALDEGKTCVYFPPGDYLITETIYIQDGQSIVGVPFGNLVQDQDLSLQYSVIKFRPSGADVVAIKNEASTDGNSIFSMALDLNDSTHTGVQFNGSYSNVIDGLMFYGTMNAGVVVHQSYVCDLNRILFNGSIVKKYCLYLGEVYVAKIDKLLTQSTTPQDAGTCMFGIAIYGNTYCIDINQPILQGPTIGIATGGSGCNSINITNPYSEEVVCTLRNGIGSGNGPKLLKVTGGNVGYPSGGSQYASRGPVIYNRAGHLYLDGVFFQQATNAGSSTGPWNILAKDQISMINCYDTSSNNGLRNIVVRSGTNNIGGFLLGNHYDVAGEQAREIILKTTGGFNAKHYGIRIDNSGTLSTTEWTPSSITGSVDSILDTEIETPATVLQ